MSPGFTELDEVEEALLRQQSWRDYRAQATRGRRPADLELLDAGINREELDKAFETVCLYEDVEFPPGDAQRAGWHATLGGARGVLGDAAERCCRRRSPEDTTCATQKAAEQFQRAVARLRSAASRRRPLLAELLECWDFAPKVTQNCWADDAATKEDRGTRSKQLHGDFRTDVVQPYLTAWRQYLYGSRSRCSANARAAAPPPSAAAATR